jgi:hypothetical protein
VKPDPGEPIQQPGLELGSARQEARTCPVCGTKFFATADREFCPVCILNRAFGAESAATGEAERRGKRAKDLRLPFFALDASLGRMLAYSQRRAIRMPVKPAKQMR